MLRSERATVALVVLLVAAIVLRAWGAAPGWGFTDADGWADLAWAGRPLAEQLTVPLTGGVAGEFANFWRPGAMLQFWIQRRLFGEVAAGWQAWDLGLHALASLAGGLFAWRHERFSGRDGRTLAAVVTLLFAAHPLADEVVPAVARNIDLLLGLACFSAMAALVASQGRRRAGEASWGLGFHAWAALALGAKESAVLLAPVAMTWVLACREDLGLRRRVVEALRVGGPLLGLIALWALARTAVLGGAGGYEAERTSGDLLLGAFRIGFIEPFLPAFGAVLGPYRGPGAWLAMALGQGLLAWAASRSPQRRLALVGAAWFGLALLLHGLTGTASRRVWYLPSYATLLVIVPALLDAWARRSWPGLTLGAAWLLSFAWGSPAFRPYPDWGAIGRASELYRESPAWSELPRKATVWLLDRPFRADLDPRRFRFWSGGGLCHGATSYSLEAWLDERFPALELQVRTLTGWILTEPLAGQSARLKVMGDELWLERKGGERPDWEVSSAWDLWTAGDELRLQPRRKLRNAVVVIWTAEGPRFWIPGLPLGEGVGGQD